jgi:pyruvate,water dikinase
MDNNFKIIKQEYNLQEELLNSNLEITEYNKKVSIKKDILLKLIKIFIKIEKIFNFDVDIEWTIKNNEVYILQVRPITTNYE